MCVAQDLIGKGGVVIRALQEATGARVNMPRNSAGANRKLKVGVHAALAQSGTLSQFHPLELTAAALTVPSAGIRCPDPGTTVSLAQDVDLPAGHRVAHWGGGSGPQPGWGGEYTVRGVPKAFWSVHSAPKPLSRWLGTTWAGGRA